MNGVRVGLLSLLAVALSAAPSFGQGLVVNGYTYIAPSLYPAPPVVFYDPALVIPSSTVIQPMNYVAPAPLVYPRPVYGAAYYPAPVAVAPTAVRQRGWYGRNGLEYKVKEYVPGRAAPVHTYRVDPDRYNVVDPDRYNVKVRERFR
jgi:hypothetical protein